MTSFCSQRCCLQHTEDTKLHVTDIVEGTESFRSTETVSRKNKLAMRMRLCEVPESASSEPTAGYYWTSLQQLLFQNVVH